MDVLIERRVINWLAKMQRRQVERDTGYGYVTVRQVADFLQRDRKSVREMLERLATEGRILRVEFSNCLAWRSINLLPWEQRAAERLAGLRQEIAA